MRMPLLFSITTPLHSSSRRLPLTLPPSTTTPSFHHYHDRLLFLHQRRSGRGQLGDVVDAALGKVAQHLDEGGVGEGLDR